VFGISQASVVAHGNVTQAVGYLKGKLLVNPPIGMEKPLPNFKPNFGWNWLATQWWNATVLWLLFFLFHFFSFPHPYRSDSHVQWFKRRVSFRTRACSRFRVLYPLLGVSTLQVYKNRKMLVHRFRTWLICRENCLTLEPSRVNFLKTSRYPYESWIFLIG